MRLLGGVYPEDLIAASTRSFASRTAVSGNPTRVIIRLSLRVTWASTLTGVGLTPTRAVELTEAFTGATYRIGQGVDRPPISQQTRPYGEHIGKGRDLMAS